MPVKKGTVLRWSDLVSTAAVLYAGDCVWPCMQCLTSCFSLQRAT